MWRIVSSDEPSKVFWMPFGDVEKRDSSGQTSSTLSRKQWPVPSSSMVSFFRSSLGTDLRRIHGWLRGTAIDEGLVVDRLHQQAGLRQRQRQDGDVDLAVLQQFQQLDREVLVEQQRHLRRVRSSWRTSGGSR